LRRDRDKYYAIHDFLFEHMSHRLILVRLEPGEDSEPEKEYPYSHLDLSTPVNRTKWKKATKMLLDALVEAEKKQKDLTDPEK
jgi:hypothetical protein